MFPLFPAVYRVIYDSTRVDSNPGVSSDSRRVVITPGVNLMWVCSDLPFVVLSPKGYAEAHEHPIYFLPQSCVVTYHMLF